MLFYMSVPSIHLVYAIISKIPRHSQVDFRLLRIPEMFGWVRLWKHVWRNYLPTHDLIDIYRVEVLWSIPFPNQDLLTLHPSKEQEECFLSNKVNKLIENFQLPDNKLGTFNNTDRQGTRRGGCTPPLNICRPLLQLKYTRYLSIFKS